MSYSTYAAMSLGEALPEVQKSFRSKHGGRGWTFMEDWKSWWKEHEHEFQKLPK
jgi:hypothetical protein